MTKELKNWTDEELEVKRQQLSLDFALDGSGAAIGSGNTVFDLSEILREQSLRKDARARPPHDFGNFDILITTLQAWRQTDHEDHIMLWRGDVITILEGIKALRR